MDPDDARSQVGNSSLDLHRNFIQNQTLISISAVLRRQTRLNRKYSRRQVCSYETWRRLSNERLNEHRRARRVLHRLKIQNEWLQEKLTGLKMERNKKRQEFQAYRSRILNNLQRRVNAEMKKRLKVERRIQTELQEYAKKLEQDICNSHDEVNRLQQKADEMERSQAQTLSKLEKDSELAVDGVARDNAFELRKRLQEVRDFHNECRARQAKEEQRFLDISRRLQNMRDEIDWEKYPKQAPDEQEAIVIEDSDQDDS